MIGFYLDSTDSYEMPQLCRQRRHNLLPKLRMLVIQYEVLIRKHCEADTPGSSVTATTVAGGIKTWSTLDACAKWVRSLGIGAAQIDIARWTPEQRGMRI